MGNSTRMQTLPVVQNKLLQCIVKDIFLFFSSARAEAYKEDGNYEYKRKNFKEASAAYTEGIKIKCDDAGLNAILYTNRATAQFYLGTSQINQYLLYFLLYLHVIFATHTKKDLNILKERCMYTLVQCTWRFVQSCLITCS